MTTTRESCVPSAATQIITLQHLNTRMNNRRTHAKPPVWLGWVGDMSTITDFLLDKSWSSPWCLLKATNSILRAIGIVAFANNPVSGVLILAAMVVGNIKVAWACLLAGVIGVLVSKILNQPERQISDGASVFNGILVGCISVAAFPDITGYPIDVKFWLFLAVTIFITSYVDKGLNSLMAPSKLPAMSIPFNITSALMLLSLRSSVDLTGTTLPQHTSASVTISDNSTEEIQWLKVMEGTLLAAGQIYGVGNIDSSILIYLGFLLFSPLLTIFCFMGSIVGTVIGALVSTAPYTDVYLGLWGYNAMLTAGGISYFMVPTPGVLLAAVVGATLSAAMQAATLHIFNVMTVPVLSYPFNMATLLILAIGVSNTSPFTWVTEKTFPEHHVSLYIRYLRRQQSVRAVHQDPEKLLITNHTSQYEKTNFSSQDTNL